jgi:hypothetical protein
MKKILSLLMVLGAAAAVHAQGTFGYFNGNTSNSDDPNGDGVGGTIYDNGAFATGSGYHAQYYIGTQGTAASGLVANGTAGPLGTGLTAGYYAPGEVATTFNPGDQVTVQLRAWKGADGNYETALGDGSKTGVSNLINLTLNASSTPGPNITTMSNINLVVAGPEPATIALGLMGASALFIRRRKV